MTFRDPGRGNAGDEVYAVLRQRITSGELPAGAQLVEAALAREFSVSRTPVREALRRLEQDGVIERSPMGGMRTKVWSIEEVFDLYDLRIVLEGHAGSVAAERRTRLDIAQLRRANERMASADMNDTEELRVSNLRFHEALWNATHNIPLIDVLERVQGQVMRHPVVTLTHPGRWEQVLREHDELIDAIEEGDADRAGAIAGDHMRAARDIRLADYDGGGLEHTTR